MRLVAYERVSTARQGRSGLGLEAQRRQIAEFAATRGAEVLARFTEVESGRKADRPELAKALHHDKVTGATLVIAKLDRLSRNAAFLLALRDSGVKFMAVDTPRCYQGVSVRLSDRDPVSGLHQGQRSHASRQQAGHMTAPRKDQQKLKSILAQTEPSTHGRTF